MSLTITHLGAQTDGTSDLNPSALIAFTVPVVLPSDGWLLAIEVELRSNAGNIGVALYADDGGEPGVMLAAHGHSGTDPSHAVYTLSSSARWVAFPLFRFLTAGTYHIGVASRQGTGGIQIRQTTGGSSGDGHTVSGSSGLINDADWTSATVAATSVTYGVRGVFATVAVDDEPEFPSSEAHEVDEAHDTHLRSEARLETSEADVVEEAHPSLLRSEPVFVCTLAEVVDESAATALRSEPTFHTTRAEEVDEAQDSALEAAAPPAPEIISTRADVVEDALDTVLVVEPVFACTLAVEVDEAIGSAIQSEPIFWVTLAEVVDEAIDSRFDAAPFADITLVTGRPRTDWASSRPRSGWSAGRPHT